MFQGVWIFLGCLWFWVHSVREGVHAVGHRFWGRLGFRTILIFAGIVYVRIVRIVRIVYFAILLCYVSIDDLIYYL